MFLYILTFFYYKMAMFQLETVEKSQGKSRSESGDFFIKLKTATSNIIERHTYGVYSFRFKCGLIQEIFLAATHNPRLTCTSLR